ncbi:hypothetical protein KY332_01820 [Candidatus Woesearchaeota archaeon]|nr:hypothetical protein [Candidatus Woesearchaeota archaeon]
MNYLKTIAIILLIVVIANLVLFSFGLITPFLFWIIILAIALIAYYIIPNLKKKQELKEK